MLQQDKKHLKHTFILNSLICYNKYLMKVSSSEKLTLSLESSPCKTNKLIFSCTNNSNEYPMNETSPFKKVHEGLVGFKKL